MSIELVMLSNHLSFCCPLLPLPSIFPSIRVFSNESAVCIRWPKYWSFSFSISLSNEYSELISFSIDWFDLLPVQGILKSLLQHHNSKASILQHSTFFMVQLSHPYMISGKTIALPNFISILAYLCPQTLLFPSHRTWVFFLPRWLCPLLDFSWLSHSNGVLRLFCVNIIVFVSLGIIFLFYCWVLKKISYHI